MDNVEAKIKNQKSKIQILVAALLLLVSLFIKAEQTPKANYTQAAAMYKANEFEKAVSLYEQILAQGYRNTEVYYNLGNSYYKLNQPGKAILDYERALKLSPSDEDIQHNLKMAEQLTKDKIEAVPQLAVVTWWKNFTCWQSASGWATLAAVTLWLAFVAFAAYLFTSFKKLTAFTGVIFLVLTTAMVLLAFRQSSVEQNGGEAIVLSSSVSVKSAPDAEGNDIFVVHEGLKLHLLDNVGTWYKVRLADGKTGWMESTTFSRI